MRHAEVVVDGQLCTSPLRTAKATDTYVLPAGEHVLEPQFTFHGFRYCELSGDVEVLSVDAVAVHSDLHRTAGFSCSDADITKLHENVVWGQRSNFLSVPTDCGLRVRELPTAELVIAPQPGGDLTWAEAWLETPRGRSSVRWDLDGDTLRVQAVIPPGYDARLEVPWWTGPSGRVEAGAFTWTFARRPS